jgi:hypothetical protein
MTFDTLPPCHHSRAIIKPSLFAGNWNTMAAESNQRKDSLKVEKLSLLILTLCIVVLVALLVFRPF